MRHIILLASVLAFTSISTASARTVAATAGTSSTALGVADTSNVAVGQSVSALFSINQNWLQTFLNINQTQGTFVFALGGAYKFTVVGDKRTGFHIGPGFTVGTAPSTKVVATTAPNVTATTGGKSEFAFSLYGMAGGHFTLADRLILSVDGGPILTVIDGDADFGFKPMGELLGLSVHYLF